MACTDTGLKMCILPAVLTLKPLKEREKKKQSQTALLCISSCALQTANTRQLQEHSKNKIKSRMRISITDFPASSPPKKWGVDTFPCCMLPGMGAPPFEQDFRKTFSGYYRFHWAVRGQKSLSVWIKNLQMWIQNWNFICTVIENLSWSSPQQGKTFTSILLMRFLTHHHQDGF